MNSISNQKSISTLSYPDDPEYYSPITAELFDDIISDNVNLSYIAIYYTKTLDNSDLYRFSMQGVPGPLYDVPFSLIDGYFGHMFEWLRGTNPSERSYYKAGYSSSEVEAIYDYLSNNSGYFFNNEEFDGKYPPPVEYVSGPHPLCTGNYSFALKIFEPGVSSFNAWMITKCTDEYPAPDHPLYALFEMLEEDFISQLE